MNRHIFDTISKALATLVSQQAQILAEQKRTNELLAGQVTAPSADVPVPVAEAEVKPKPTRTRKAAKKKDA